MFACEGKLGRTICELCTTTLKMSWETGEGADGAAGSLAQVRCQTQHLNTLGVQVLLE